MAGANAIVSVVVSQTNVIASRVGISATRSGFQGNRAVLLVAFFAIGVSGTAIDSAVSTLDCSARGNGNGKVALASPVKVRAYGLVAVQDDVALVFFVSESQAVAPAAEGGAFLGNGFEVDLTASSVAGNFRFAVLLEVFTAISSAVYLAVFFAGILTGVMYADDLTLTFAGFPDRDGGSVFAGFGFFIESGGDRPVLTHSEIAGGFIVERTAIISPGGEFVLVARFRCVQSDFRSFVDFYVADALTVFFVFVLFGFGAIYATTAYFAGAGYFHF